MSKYPIALAASLAAVLAAPAAAASVPAEARAVAHADLNLSSAAGRARLDRRINAAVRAVCGAGAPTDLRAASEIRLCRANALSRLAGPAVGATR